MGNLFLSFEGRIGRLRYWIGSIVVLALSATIQWMLGVPLTGETAGPHLRIIVFVINIISIYPTAAIAVKRMHDRNQPGTYVWILAAALVVVTLGDLFGFFDDTADITFVTWVVVMVVFVIGLAFLIELGFRRGTSGPNQYGPDLA